MGILHEVMTKSHGPLDLNEPVNAMIFLSVCFSLDRLSLSLIRVSMDDTKKQELYVFIIAAVYTCSCN